MQAAPVTGDPLPQAAGAGTQPYITWRARPCSDAPNYQGAWAALPAGQVQRDFGECTATLGSASGDGAVAPQLRRASGSTGGRAAPWYKGRSSARAQAAASAPHKETKRCADPTARDAHAAPPMNKAMHNSVQQ
jgi:hypothetical protein